jgi:putative tricarboxylic transport membrane protein
MARRNVIAACVLLTITLLYGVLTAGLPARSLPNTPGPAFFPWLITAALATLSTALLVRGLRGSREPGRSVPSPVTPRGWLALAAFLIYVALLPVLGFLIASVPFFAALMFLYGEHRRLHIALTAMLVPTLVFVVFRYAFQMLLPPGLGW